MKALIAAAIVLMAWAAQATEVIRAKPDGTTNTETYALNLPGFTTSHSGMQIYSEKDKEHVFNLAPSAVLDPGAEGSGLGFQSSLSPGQQSSMGVQLGIPIFGSPEAAQTHHRAPAAGTRGDIPIGN